MDNVDECLHGDVGVFVVSSCVGWGGKLPVTQLGL